MPCRQIQIEQEAYELLKAQKRDGHSIKRLASEPIIKAYKAEAAHAAAEAARRAV